jgi:signal transduction histidine kinase
METKKDFKKLQEKYEQLEDKFKIIDKENKNNVQKVYDYKESRRALAHGLRGSLARVMNNHHLIKYGEIDKQTKGEIMSDIEKDLSLLLNLSELIHLDGLEKEELKKESKQVYLEEIARNHITTYENLMKKENIEAKIKYNKGNKINDPLSEVYVNQGVFNTIWESLIGNAFNYAPPNSIIRQGIGVNEENYLEILTENEHHGERARDVSGMKKNIGVPFTKRIISTLGGTYSNYFENKIKKENYSLTESYGKKAVEKKDSSEIWGVKIQIPLEELIEKSY